MRRNGLNGGYRVEGNAGSLLSGSGYDLVYKGKVYNFKTAAEREKFRLERNL